MESSLCLPSATGCGSILWSLVNQPVVTPEGKLTLLLSASIICSDWGFLHTFSTYPGPLSGLGLHKACVCCHRRCEFICATTLWCPGNTFSLYSSATPGSDSLSVPSSTVIPEPEKVRYRLSTPQKYGIVHKVTWYPCSGAVLTSVSFLF